MAGSCRILQHTLICPVVMLSQVVSSRPASCFLLPALLALLALLDVRLRPCLDGPNTSGCVSGASRHHVSPTGGPQQPGSSGFGSMLAREGSLELKAAEQALQPAQRSWGGRMETG